ncbi:MAG TPA: hypothetical protein VL633_03105, partial [Bacteroidota bacterium]|nr:hypothetical protein [Bacteroidota bacterium]
MKKISGILFCVCIFILNSSLSAGTGPHSLYFSAGDLTITVATNPPSVVTGAASSITSTSVQFNSTVNPNGDPTNAWFDWDTTTFYSNSTPQQSVGNGAVNVPVSQTVGGLTPNTLYHFRGTADNSGGSGFGSDLTVTTLAIPPTVTTLSVTGVTISAVTFHGSANPNNSSTSGHFEWGPDTTYGNSTSSQPLG